MTSTSPSPAATGHGVAVVFEDMHRWYGPVHALNGLSIDIAPGELDRPARPVGLRQDDRAPRARRARRGGPGPGSSSTART